MAEMVRAMVMTAPRTFELREFPRPVIGPDEGLLRVEACGICGSDVEQYKGHLSQRGLPMVPGHEPLGIIEEVGEKAAQRWGVSPGDRVALEILIPCRSCELCLTGRYMACKNRQGSYGGYNPGEPRLNGGFAEYIHLHPNSILHPIRADIPAEIAVMYNPLGAGVRWAVHLGEVGLGSTVLVLGAGQRGLGAVIAAKAVGAQAVIVTGLARDHAKLALAREFGADHTIDVEAEDTVARVKEITGGDGVDVALEFTPMATEPVSHAIQSIRHGGRVVLAGLKGGKEHPLNTDMIINKGATVVGAFSVDARGYGDAIAIIESGRFPLARLHTHSFGLADVARAIETLAGEVEGETAVHVSIHPDRG
ncbi:MAG TPA: zinc-binding dehydrogenase [Streptosporangiaceae bacterium]|jgi:threonine dehydrogenase-like Zn-dependent dehydrogenase